MARATWVITVDWLTYRRRAMSSLDSPCGDQADDFALAGREFVQGAGRMRRTGAGRELGDQPTGDAG
jgi:hypothetical protein